MSIVTMIGWLTIFAVGAVGCMIVPVVLAETMFRGRGIGPLIASVWFGFALLALYFAGWLCWFFLTYEVSVHWR